MTLGPGKYDPWTSLVREDTRAHAVILIIVAGKHGSGFSCQAPPGFTARLPELLRQMADGVEDDLRAGRAEGLTP